MIAGRLVAAVGAVVLALPAFTAPVVDEAGVVPDDVERSVSAQLNDYQGRAGNQVAVAVVRTTGAQSLEDYSIDLAREWGVGKRGEDNGVLLLVAIDDRRVRIEVGRGLEDELTDLEAGEIVRDRLVPLLRVGDVGGAVRQGTEAIRASLGDATVGALPPPPAPVDDGGGGDGDGFGGILPILVFGAFALTAMGGRGRRRWGGGVPIFWGGGFGGSHGSSGGGGGGFSGGGGGFSGGGGGGFGGGGASGSW